MSGRAVGGFVPTLRKVDRELAIPMLKRLKVLRELQYDLEELRERLQSEGVPSEEAAARAVEVLAPDEAALGELRRLHASTYQRLTTRLGADLLRLGERSALALATSFVLVMEALLLLRADLLNDPSVFVWPTLGLGALPFAAITTMFFQLWIKAEHGDPSRRFGAIVWLSIAIGAVGVVGVLADTLQLATALESSPDLAGPLTLHWLVQDAVLVAITILLTITGALAWFVASQWVAEVSAIRTEILGLDSRPSSKSR